MAILKADTPLHVGDTTNAEVLAGLVNDGSAETVARAAVALALELGCPVHFVQVRDSALLSDVGANADPPTFHAALRALHGHPRLSSTFEVVTGDPGAVLVQRSGHAQALVIGQDAPAAESGPAGRSAIALYCQEHARCAVRTVPTGL